MRLRVLFSTLLTTGIAVLLLLSLSIPAFAQTTPSRPEIPAVEVTGQTDQGKSYTIREAFLETPSDATALQTEQKYVGEIFREALKEKAHGLHVETFISSDDESSDLKLKQEIAPIEEEIKILPPDTRPVFVRWKEIVTDKVKAQVVELKEHFKGYTRPGIVMATVQSGINIFFWIHFSNGYSALQNTVGAAMNILVNFITTPRPEFLFRAGPFSGSNETTAEIADGVSAYIPALFSAGILKTVVNWHHMQAHASLMTGLDSVAFFAAETAAFFSSFDLTAKKWARLYNWPQMKESPMAPRSIITMIWIKNLAAAALVPLIVRGNHPATVVGGAIGVVGLSFFFQGQKLIPWVKEQVPYKILTEAFRRFSNRFSAKQKGHLKKLCMRLLDF